MRLSVDVNRVEMSEFVRVSDNIDVLDLSVVVEGKGEGRRGRFLELDQGTVHTIQVHQNPFVIRPVVA